MQDIPLQAITDGHEERIQRLEQAIPAFSVQLATQTQEIKRVNEILEDSFQRLNANLVPLADQIKVTMETNARQETRLGALELAEDTRTTRKKAIKKYTWVAIIGAGGILGTKLVEYGWKILSALFQ